MLSVESLLGIICTESITGDNCSCKDYTKVLEDIKPQTPAYEKSSKTHENLPPILYNLELIRLPDGTLKWVE